MGGGVYLARNLVKSTKEKMEYVNNPKEHKLSTQLVPDKKEDNTYERKRALAFEKIQQILLQNVSKNSNKTFTQYTKELIKQYLKNPYNYRNEIREVSRYLYRVSSLYKKIVLYYATIPMYYYNVTPAVDFAKSINVNKSIKDYQSFLKRLQGINFQKECIPIITTTIRDGIYCGFVYSNDDNGFFIHTLDPKYYKIRGKNECGQWIVYFDATYFASGNNKEFVDGINGDTSGTWDQVFIDGWNDYNDDTTNNRWFMLPPEKTICLIANMDDEFDMPLPFFSGIFTSLLDCLDYEQVIADKTTLENYCLLVATIPLIKDSNMVDDFAVSMELVQEAQDMIADAVPDLVGFATLPGMELNPITFKDKNTANDTDILSNSVENVFNQAGVSRSIISNGSSTNSVGLKHSIQNDTSISFIWVDRLQSNLQYYFSSNISPDYIFSFHKETWYSKEEYIKELASGATTGVVTAMDYMTALGSTPYEAYCKILFEEAIGIKLRLTPLSTSYTQSSKNSSGRPASDDDDLSEEGIATRDGEKNNT